MKSEEANEESATNTAEKKEAATSATEEPKAEASPPSPSEQPQAQESAPASKGTEETAPAAKDSDSPPSESEAPPEKGGTEEPAAAQGEPKPKEVPAAAVGGFSDKQRPAKPHVRPRGVEPELWIPKTRLGKMVKDGEITNISDALNQGLPLREPEIVDILLPDLDDEVLDVNMVQRMTDSGRRVKFAITTVVGNKDGYVGLGHSKGKEVGPAIRKAIDNAKVNIMEIKRGCGSWECGCDKAHSLPFVVKGKSGSTEVHLKPAPKGIDLAVGNIAKHILRLAGIKDAWGFTKGETRTTINYAKAIIAALRKTAEMKLTDDQMQKLHIIKGSLGELRPEGEGAEAGLEEKPEAAPEAEVKPAPTTAAPSASPPPPPTPPEQPEVLTESTEAKAAKPKPEDKDKK